MRIVVSIQSKRGSSRGLVHYVAHSKIDPEKEPAHGRELFNGFGDWLDVKSANNSLKVDISRRRPSNDELHHLVLSFRAEDFAKLGSSEKERRRAAKHITRSAMTRLANALSADKLAWAAAVHVNTVNPHVHIAIQKQYFTRDLERKTLTKIPRDAIPHYEKTRDGTKQFSPGFLIEAASEKMEEIIHQNQARGKRRSDQSDHRLPHKPTAEERVLAEGLIRKLALKTCTEKLKALTHQGNKMRFLVFDVVTGTNRRMSLEDIAHRAESLSSSQINRRYIADTATAEDLKNSYLHAELEHNANAVRRIRTILFKLTAKEETRRQELEKKFKATDRQVAAIRTACRQEGRKLQTPALTKPELDQLQEQCLAADDIRTFAYLERVRSELSASGKIESRDDRDTQRLSGLKVVHSLRSELYKKQLKELNGNRFVRSVDLNDTRWSLSELENRGGQLAFGYRLLGKIGFGAKPQGGEREQPAKDVLRKEIVEKLDLEDRQANARQHREEKKAKLIADVLKTNEVRPGVDPRNVVFDSNQLAEIESLSFRLKDTAVYKRSWEMQKLLIERAEPTSRIGRKIFNAHASAEAEKVLAERKKRVLADRALAREIVSRIQLDEAKSNVKRFSRAKQFHKFEVVNGKSGARDFVSLKDVEVAHSGSLLHQAVDYLTESRERREMRRAVKKEIKEKEKDLKAELKGAKEIFNSASKAAAEHRNPALFSLKSLPIQEPIFTASELGMIERHFANSTERKDLQQFQRILNSARENAVDSLERLLTGFENYRGKADDARERNTQTGLGRESK